MRPVPWAGVTGPVSRRLEPIRLWLPFASAAGAALVVTLALPVVAPLQFAYPAPSLRVALDTGMAVIGLLATAIVVRGWRDGLRLDRLVIAAGLALIAVTFAVLTTLLTVAPGHGPRARDRAHRNARRVGAARRRRVRARRARCGCRGRAVLSMAAITLARAGGRGRPGGARARAGRRSRRSTLDVARPVLSQPLAAIVLQSRGAAGLVLAAVGLTGARSARRATRSLAGSGSPCCSSPSPSSTTPCSRRSPSGCTGRRPAAAVLPRPAVGGRRGGGQRPSPRRAAEGERRRIARDLHDGVAQELAFIRRRAVRLAGQPDAEDIVVAADRALLDSRWAIEHLRRAGRRAARPGARAPRGGDRGAHGRERDVLELRARRRPARR